MDDSTATAPTSPGTPSPIGELGTSPLSRIPVSVSVCVGRAHPLIGELVDLTPDAVLPLDRDLDDPVELFVGDKLIARGTLTQSPEGRLAVRLTEVADMDDRG